MKYTLSINISNRKHPIIIESGLFQTIGNRLGEHFAGKKIALITDENIVKVYGDFL